MKPSEALRAGAELVERGHCHGDYAAVAWCFYGALRRVQSNWYAISIASYMVRALKRPPGSLLIAWNDASDGPTVARVMREAATLAEAEGA